LINVYLDDVRPCPRGFVPARSAEECLLLLEAEEVDMLSLDFELGFGMPNGLAVVHAMIATGRYPKRVFVHSSSMMGRALMVRALREAAPAGLVVHDGPMTEDVLREAAAAAREKDAGR